MSRYRVIGAQAECEPGSDGLVLRNLLGITDPEEMEHVEQVLLRQLYGDVLSDPTCQQRLTTAMLNSWHSRWLGNVYSWAGAQRTVNIAKDGFPFATATFLYEQSRGVPAGAIRCVHTLQVKHSLKNCSMR